MCAIDFSCVFILDAKLIKSFILFFIQGTSFDIWPKSRQGKQYKRLISYHPQIQLYIL